MPAKLFSPLGLAPVQYGAPRAPAPTGNNHNNNEAREEDEEGEEKAAHSRDFPFKAVSFSSARREGKSNTPW